MTSPVKKWLSEIRKGESGMILPVVLIMLTMGSLLTVPVLNYVATGIKTGEMVERKVEGLYAAEAGVEDALWKIRNDTPASFPYSYQLTDVNGLSVNVVIDEVATIAGEEVGSSGGHEDYLEITKEISYEAGTYFYTLNLTNNGTGNMKIEMILIDFPPELEYVVGSTSGNITGENPSINGDPTSGITLVWEMQPPYPSITVGYTEGHIFQLSGPPGVEGVEGHGVVRATRDDVGTVWDTDSRPYSIIAEAKDATDKVLGTIRAGVWEGNQLDISCWEVNR